jgi:isochorismate pyruvate lyase
MIDKSHILQPAQCENISDVRREIDYIDQQIIEALARRFKYVKAAAKFKTSDTSVKAPQRLKTMLAQRRIWAIDNKLNADIVEKMFGDLIAYFIDEELKERQENKLNGNKNS